MDSVETPEEIITLTQYYEEGDLNQLFKKTVLQLKEKERLAFECIRGVFHLHVEEILHRDLKPANIFLKKDLRGGLHPYIGDLGLSCKFSSEIYLKRAVGTLSYLPPEYWAPQLLKTTSETFHATSAERWALGCTLFQLLHPHHKRLPFQNLSIGEISKHCLNHITSESIAFNLKALNNIHPMMLNVVEELLEIDPHKRLSITEAYSSLLPFFPGL